MPIRRRDLFRLGGVGTGIGLVGAAAWSALRRWGPRDANATPLAALGIDCSAEPSQSAGGVGYLAPFAPAGEIPGGRDPLHTPPPPAVLSTQVQQYDLSVVESRLEVAGGHFATVWAYGGTVPGPIIRAAVGQRIRVTLANGSGTPHTVHFHGAHDVMQDGLQRVGAGRSGAYEFEAGPAGLHPYHCHVPPYAWHMGRGMYGAMIVDPVGGRAPAHEFVLCLGGFDTDGDGRNDFYAWNGLAGYYERYPLKVPAGELVRLYVMNMVEHDPVASFHLHAQTFDLYRSGTSAAPQEHTDIVSLGPAERAVLEFRLPRRGRYMFHPHQSHMAERGAMGWIVAI